MGTLNILKQLEASNGGYISMEGSYFKGINPTIGTGINSPTATTFSATSCMLSIQNPLGIWPGSASYHQRPATPLGEGSTFMVLDYFKFLITAADTTATSWQWAITVDTTNRYSSGGTTPSQFCTNPLVSSIPSYAPKASIHVGAVTLTAASANVIQIGRGSAKKVTTAPLLLVDDEIVFSFGRGDSLTGFTKGGGTSGTNPALYRQHAGVVCVPPGCTFMMHSWFPAISAAFSFEFELGWEEIQL